MKTGKAATAPLHGIRWLVLRGIRWSVLPGIGWLVLCGIRWPGLPPSG
ncbi:MAG TPA: hypothetical protein VGQ47_02080 [Candidatus Limnocylindrales bacterium]|nr:hypothetical protein [Candidatus Limnocylindrales bacterium]